MSMCLRILKEGEQASRVSAQDPYLTTERYADGGEAVVESFLKSLFLSSCDAFPVTVLQARNGENQVVPMAGA